MNTITTTPKVGDIITNAKGTEYRVTKQIWANDYSEIVFVFAIKADGTTNRSTRFNISK